MAYREIGGRRGGRGRGNGVVAVEEHDAAGLFDSRVSGGERKGLS